MLEKLAAKWDARYRDADPKDVAPAQVLEDFAHLLPERGRALDLACGLGGNARLLAERGLEVTAWDLSAEAIAKLEAYAGEHALSLRAARRDVTAEPPRPGSFDVIVVGRFLERSLAPALVRALRPGGLLFYQTFSRDAVDDSGPANPAFRLAPNELLTLFRGLRVAAYREEGTLGDTTRGLRNEAYLVAWRAD